MVWTVIDLMANVFGMRRAHRCIAGAAIDRKIAELG